MRLETWALCLLLSLFIPSSSAQNNSCSGTVILNATEQLQYLTTPDYDTSYTYPPFLDCRFVIKAPDKTRIVINVIDLEMEPRLFDECPDFVRLTEDATDTNTSGGITLCESIKNRQYISSLNTFAVIFHTDDYFEFRGARLSYQYYNYKTCPQGWTELSDENCVKIESDQKTDWIKAQKRCIDQKSNLVMIDNSQKTYELEGYFKSVPTRLWVGYTDSNTEGRLVGVHDVEATRFPGRDMGTLLPDNNEENDCMTLQFGDNVPYRMNGCAYYNGYICEMKKDGTNGLYPPHIDIIKEGVYHGNQHYMLWLLLFLICLLFLTVLAFLCFMCYKQKNPRVHTEATTIQHNAFMSESSPMGEQSRTSASAPISAISQPSHSNETRPPRSGSSAVAVSMENNRQPKRFPMAPIPNRLPMTDPPSDSANPVETAIMGAEVLNEDTVSAAPRALPRTLPPMPAREGTFQSINTRDGSTMRTRRNKELFERPIMNVLDNVSAISLDEFWSNKKTQKQLSEHEQINA